VGRIMTGKLNRCWLSVLIYSAQTWRGFRGSWRFDEVSSICIQVDLISWPLLLLFFTSRLFLSFKDVCVKIFSQWNFFSILAWSKGMSYLFQNKKLNEGHRLCFVEKRVVCVKLLAVIMNYSFIDLAIKNYRKKLVKWRFLGIGLKEWIF